MVTRILDATPAELLKMKGRELLESIRNCEGRVIVAEVIVGGALFKGVSNAELAAAFSADLLLLNMYNVYEPHFYNIESEGQELILKVKEYTGRPVGINLEPVSEDNRIPEGRRANHQTARLAYQQGADFILLTGNPATGVTTEQIIHTIEDIKKELGDKLIIMAGKMHMAGVREDYLDKEAISGMIEAGADVILFPLPGSVPGITVEDLKKAIDYVHSRDALVMNALGTSQESADQDTIRQLAINSKMSGADIHHIGDGGYGGMALPENIMNFSIAIRGKRHTYKRMALSLKRE